MPTASDLLLNLSIQIEGEKGLNTLAQEIASLEAEQFKYNKQAQQTTVITQGVESSTKANSKAFREQRTALANYEAAAKKNVATLQGLLQNQKLTEQQREQLNAQLEVAQDEVNKLNRAQGLLSDQMRMAESTVSKYGQETQANSDRQEILSNNLADLTSRLDAVKTRARDLQTQMRSSGEMTEQQADEFRKVSDRARELEKDAEKLTRAFGNNRQETNAYRKVLADTRAVQSRLSDTVNKSQGTFALLSGRIADVNRSVNTLKNEFFESDLRAQDLAKSGMTLAEANKVVEKENIEMTQTMQQHREVLRGMRDDLHALVDANELTRDEFNKLDKQLNSATANAGTSQRALQNLSQAFGSSAQVQNRATQALISFSQGLQDSPQFMMSAGAGFRAISNNLTQFQHMVSLLNESVKEANGGTASFGMTAKALARGIMGPAGIMIAFTAVTTAIAFYTANLDRTKRKTKELSQDTGDFIDKLSSLRQPLFADAFGTAEFVYQAKDVKSFLSDIEGAQQRIAVAKFERLNPIALIFSGQASLAGAQAARQIELIGDAYKDAFEIERATDIPIFATTRKLAEPLRELLADQIQLLNSTQGQLERFAKKYNLTAKEAEDLAERLEAVNDQINVNNFLLENSPLAQELERRRRQLAIFEIEAEHGELTVKRAELERSALQRLNQGRAESIFRLDSLISSHVVTDERRKEAVARLGELNASYEATSAVIDFLTSFIDSNTESTERNNEALRDQYYFREQARQQAREINQDAQKALDFLGAENISDARLRAQRILDIRLDAAMKEGRTMLEQQLLMAQARAEYNNTIRRLDEEEARMAEEKRDRINKANHELNMIRIRQTMDGNEQLEALHKAERDFLFQQLVDEAIIYEQYELKKTQLAEKYANLRAGIQEKESNDVFGALQTGLQQVSQVFGALNQLSTTRAQVSEEAARREFEVQKRLSYASAVVNAAAAAVGVLRDTKGGTFARLAGMTAVLAAAAIQIETIRNQQFTSSGGSSDGATASFGTSTTQVQEPREFTMPNYMPSADSEFRGRQTTVQILADRKQLYSLVHEGEREYRQRQV